MIIVSFQLIDDGLVLDFALLVSNKAGAIASAFGNSMRVFQGRIHSR
jgi:hypothetical protein